MVSSFGCGLPLFGRVGSGLFTITYDSSLVVSWRDYP